MCSVNMNMSIAALLVCVLAMASLKDARSQTVTTADLMQRCYNGLLIAADGMSENKDKPAFVGNNNARKHCLQTVGNSIFNKNRLQSYAMLNAASAVPTVPQPGTTTGARKLLSHRGLLTTGCTSTSYEFNWVSGPDTATGLTVKSYTDTTSAKTITVRAYRAVLPSAPNSPAIGSVWTVTSKTAANIHQKNAGGELGLGITGETNNEINKNTFMQMELPDEAKVVSVVIDSVQSGETYALYGSSEEGKPGALVAKGVGTSTSGITFTENVAGPASTSGHKYVTLTVQGQGTSPNDILLQNGLRMIVETCPPPETTPTNLCASRCGDPNYVLLPGERSSCGTFNPCDCCSVGIAFATNIALTLQERVNVSKVFDTAVRSRGWAAMSTCQADVIVGPGGLATSGGSTQCTSATQIDVVNGIVTSTSSSISTYDPTNGGPTGSLPVGTNPADTSGSTPTPVPAPTCPSPAGITGVTPYTVTCPLGVTPCCTIKFPVAVGENVVDSCSNADPNSYCDVSADATSSCLTMKGCGGCRCAT